MDPATTQPEARPAVHRSDAGWLVLLVATTAFIVLTARSTIRNHDGFGTLGYDLGIFDQGVWLLSRLRNPFVTIMGRRLFGDHLSFILVPLALVYRVVPSAKVLLVAQAMALGIAAVPVFLIAREKLRHELLASVIAVAFLAHPALAWTGFDQFHPDAFEVPLVLFTFWFAERRRWRWFLACVVALLLVKEDVPLLTFALGIYVAVRYDRRIGMATCALSAAYFVFAFAVVKPTLGVGGGMYAPRIPFGGAGGSVRTAILHPATFLRYLLADGRPFYVWQMLVSFGGVPVLAPGVLALATGPLGANVVSTYVYQHRLRYHYGTLILPVLVVAGIVGLAKVRPPRARVALAGLVAASAITGGYLWGPLPVDRHPAYVVDPAGRLARDARAAIRLIPADAAVSAFYPFTTHLTHRERVYEFPNPFRAHWWGLQKEEGQRLPEADSVDYVVLAKDAAYLGDPEVRAAVASLQGDFVTAYDSESVLLLHRRR